MKYLIFLLFLPLASLAQNDSIMGFPFKNGAVVYENVVSVNGADKTELYYRAKRVTINKYKNTKEGTYIDSKDDGIITAKATSEYLYQKSFQIKTFYTIEVAVKDGRYRIRVDNITYSFTYSSKFIGQADISKGTIEKLIEDVKSANKKESAIQDVLMQVKKSVESEIEYIKDGMTKKVSSDF